MNEKPNYQLFDYGESILNTEQEQWHIIEVQQPIEHEDIFEQFSNF